MRLGDRIVLREVSFEAESGYHVVLGPSGSGKTTLLRAIAGLVEAEEGRVSICGVDVTGLPPWERGVAMVQQLPGLLPHLTLLENVALAARVRGGLPRDEARRRARELLEELGLGEAAGRRPGEVSGGQLQRAALAVALASEPRLLLLDEPLSHLDRYTAERIRRLLSTLPRRYGVPVVHVTHDLDEALSLAGSMTIIRGGRVEASGEAWSIYRCPRSRGAAELLGHSVVRGEALGLPGGLYSVPPEAVILLARGGEWRIADMARERGRLLVEARHMRLGDTVRSYLHPRDFKLNIGDVVDVELADEPCPVDVGSS